MKMKVSKNKLFLIFITFIFLLSYHYSYVYFIYPTFSYAYYGYHPSGVAIVFLAYLCALFPLFYYKNFMTPANYGLILVYTFCFAPSLLTISFQWNSDVLSLFFILVMLSLSMSFLFCCVYFKRNNKSYVGLKSNISRLFINILTFISLVYLVHDNYKHMRLVGFYDVYALRFEARDSGSSVLSGYLSMWLSICFIPYYTALGLMNKKWRYILLSFAFSLLVYASNGSKSTLLMPFVVIAMFLLTSYKKINFLTSVIALMTLGMLILTAIDSPDFIMIKAIFFMRTLATPGWTLVTYYDYFTEHGLTYFSHIGIINYLTELYPYGDFSLGQMIGLDYSGSSDANFNANFWATDGFASLGMVGILPATLFLGIILRVIDRISVNYNPIFVALWLTGFWMTILNAPITTSLLSGGGIIVLVLLKNKYDIKIPRIKSLEG